MCTSHRRLEQENLAPACCYVLYVRQHCTCAGMDAYCGMSAHRSVSLTCESFVHVVTYHKDSHILTSRMVNAGCVSVAGIHQSWTWMTGSLESVRWNAYSYNPGFSLLCLLEEQYIISPAGIKLITHLSHCHTRSALLNTGKQSQSQTNSVMVLPRWEWRMKYFPI